jgi:hypothetical protein
MVNSLQSTAGEIEPQNIFSKSLAGIPKMKIPQNSNEIRNFISREFKKRMMIASNQKNTNSF